ncbi:MAG: PQQ-like beta-propeller repeat protein [Clostridia bacterium]|nr:PQQ-like beta-propeller repeat protein [Clostridia bacterium]
MAAKKKKHKKRRRLIIHPRFFLVVALLVLALGVLILLLVSLFSGEPAADPGAPIQTTEGQKKGSIFQIFAKETPTPTPTPTPKPTPHYVDNSNPGRYGYVQHLEVNGKEADVSGYTRSEEISFGDSSDYAQVPGVLTFRGNNYRNLSAAEELNLTEFKMTQAAKVSIGSLKKGNRSGKGSWSGCGWTGQPLIVQWSDEVKAVMNLYDWAKQKANLVEVIYPTEDGHIYFLDLETGKKTRDDLNFKMPFKGTGSIDPRGLPLLYVGSGDEYEEEDQKSRAMIISLIDGRKLYEFGVQGRDTFAVRQWNAYDSAPLIDEQTDTLIWPAETGILYTMKLNTVFDARGGTITVNPSHIVKLRYDSNNSYDKIDKADSSHKWLGYEGSAAVWNGFIYLASNDGLFQCIDLNTMQIKWIADTKDDTNASPVLDVISETEAYLYVGTSLHFTQDSAHKGVTPFFKINAMTGEIVGQYQLTVETVSGVSGGIQATAAVGQNNLSDLVFVPFARYNGKDKGVLVALYKDTMEPAWSMPMEHYAWSSPAIFYNSKGDGYLVQADSGGDIFLIDGRTGKQLDKISPTKNGSNFEASPALFGNMLVIGSRGDQTIFFIRLS